MFIRNKLQKWRVMSGYLAEEDEVSVGSGERVGLTIGREVPRGRPCHN